MAMYRIIRKYGIFTSNFQSSFLQENIFCRRIHIMQKSIASVNFNFFWNRVLCSLNNTSLDYNTFGCKYSGDSRRRCSTEVKSNVKEKEIDMEFTFQNELHLRQRQAQHSVLVELPSKADALPACALCQDFGDIEKVFSYSGESNNVFLLIEFSKKEAVDRLLSSCQCSNILDAFPVFSRLIQYKRKNKHELQKLDVNIIEDAKPEASQSNLGTISELIESIYLTEKLSELNTRLRYFFCLLLKDSVSGVFPYCEVLPFGSSVNGVGKHGCDLDVIIRLYPKKIDSEKELLFLSKTCVGDTRALQQRAIFCLGDYIRTFLPGVSSLQKIIHARVPIMKLKHKILKMDCDVSINNMSAVLMSELIYFCGEVDHRVRPLIYAVKKWAKEANITSESPGTWITNFGLSMLVLFFLQNRPLPILPAFNDAVQIIDEESSTQLKVLYKQSLSDLRSKASLNKETLAVLLQEFLTFVGTYPFNENHISLLTGSALPRNDGSPLWIQYPMEEDLNVTKNVSHHEMWDLCEKAFASSKYLASNMNYKVNKTRDLASLLGIPNIKRLEFKKSPKLDVGLLMNDSHNKNVKKKPVKKRAF
ncbi:poly(A) RNA polymerase, mitochondrial-like [Uloborus diversus]|uniref:poly(A) RNA polymerase, mitochondrial-like n=1 Tax=Uloborus diversus TaxID=327109 RepID=UPI00240A955D|nr:poly(A) RNA polymerase, mitochondrial-like [Uloborus diversus]